MLPAQLPHLEFGVAHTQFVERHFSGVVGAEQRRDGVRGVVSERVERYPPPREAGEPGAALDTVAETLMDDIDLILMEQEALWRASRKAEQPLSEGAAQ